MSEMCMIQIIFFICSLFQCMADMLRYVISHLGVHCTGGVIRMDNFGHITELFLSSVYIYKLHMCMIMINLCIW
uniref:Secreted protein n=1 Tax=Triticum urartu TaxID=4572 RepID=A0A8R7Q555_TRIUA